MGSFESDHGKPESEGTDARSDRGDSPPALTDSAGLGSPLDAPDGGNPAEIGRGSEAGLKRLAGSDGHADPSGNLDESMRVPSPIGTDPGRGAEAGPGDARLEQVRDTTESRGLPEEPAAHDDSDPLVGMEVVLSGTDGQSRTAGERLASAEGAEHWVVNESLDFSDVDSLHVTAHGARLSDGTVGIELDGARLDAAEFAEYLRDKGFGGSEVHLVVCYAGGEGGQSTPFAETLAQELDARVTAYDQEIAVGDDPLFGMMGQEGRILDKPHIDLPFTDRFDFDLPAGVWSGEADPVVFDGGDPDEEENSAR